MFGPKIPEIKPKDLKEKVGEFTIIDVRRPDEFKGELGHIEGAALVTLETDFQTYIEKLPKDPSYVFVCRSGARSGKATEMAQAKGFTKVFNLAGGMIAWNNEGLPIEK